MHGPRCSEHLFLPCTSSTLFYARRVQLVKPSSLQVEIVEFDSLSGYQFLTSDLTLAREEVRDLWQVRVGAAMR